MKTSTEIGSISKIVGRERAVELCAKAGFDAWDFSMSDMKQIDWLTGRPLTVEPHLKRKEYLDIAKKLKKIGLDNGIVCNQSHAPFPVSVPIVRDCLELSIECTAEAGGEICIIHPDNNKTPEQNAEMYAELLPFAKNCGVKIATENMFNWRDGEDHSCPAACSTSEDFCRHIDVVNDEFFVACLDLGHAEMRGSGGGAANMIRALGSRLKALHIHDNDRRDDCHQIPFSMNIDFYEIVRALKEVSYDGYLTLEANSFMRDYNEETVFEGVMKLHESVAKLSDIFNKI
jgi:sugar phosphate isomerase/epimerase